MCLGFREDNLYQQFIYLETTALLMASEEALLTRVGVEDRDPLSIRLISPRSPKAGERFGQPRGEVSRSLIRASTVWRYF
jgi:hypothetical protein